MKKFFALALIFSFLLPDLSSAKFSDVYNFNKNRTAILTLQELGVISGYADGTFHPHDKINRAELVKILVEGQGITPDENLYRDCFPDVTDQWFAPYVCYAKEQGWIAGYPDGNFRPEQLVNKVESIKILINANELDTEDIDTELFLDTDDSAWYAKYLRIAKAKGLLEEDGEDIFEPTEDVKRMAASENIFRILALQNSGLAKYDTDTVKSNLDTIKNNFRLGKGAKMINTVLDEEVIEVEDPETEDTDTENSEIFSAEIVELAETEKEQGDFARLTSDVWKPVVRVISTFTETVGFGSGTIVTEDGLVITNAHVIQNEDGKLADAYDICIAEKINESPLKTLKNCFSADFIAKVFDDEGGDIALLKIKSEGRFKYAKILQRTDTDPIADYQVRIMGYPGDGDAAMTNAITSILQQIRKSDDPYSLRVLVDKSDSLMDHGISGGTVYDERNYFVGIPSEGNDTEGAYIPLSVVRSFLKDLSEAEDPLITYDDYIPALVENYQDSENYQGGQDSYSYVDQLKNQAGLVADTIYPCQEEQVTYQDFSYQYKNVEQNIKKKYGNNLLQAKYLLPKARLSLYRAKKLASIEYDVCSQHNYWKKTLNNGESVLYVGNCGRYKDEYESHREDCYNGEFYSANFGDQKETQDICSAAIEAQNLYFDCLYANSF